MSGWKKLAAASAAGGETLDVDDVFSTYLWVGDQTARNIVNGIDLSTEGGLVWTKNRDTSGMSHALVDTERGANKILTLPSTGAELDSSGAYGVNGFNTDGFSLPSGEGAYYENRSGKDAASWTFRKAPKFFDVVTYTGDGANTRSISHNLGCQAGMVIVKRLNAASNWAVWHQDLTSGGGSGGGDSNLVLNSSGSELSISYINGANSSSFTVGGGAGFYNGSGDTHVAYVFAHNNNDGGFGPDGDQDIIKCGSYTGAANSGVTLNLGFEPQFIMIKRSNSSALWTIIDNMRGMPNGGNSNVLYPNTSQAEADPQSNAKVYPTPTGLYIEDDAAEINISGSTYIYMAIRRGPLAVPESATDVFAVANHGTSNPAWVSGFRTDMAYTIGGGAPYASDRLRGSKLSSMFSNAAEANNNNVTWDWRNGYHSGTSYSPAKAHMWKRAPGFFDVVAYTGNGTAGRTISHNLGVAPEMIWVKARSNARQWQTYDAINGATGGMDLDDAGPWGAGIGEWYNTAPTSSVFTVGNDYDVNAAAGYTYIAYLFATLAGISKVGGYTGNGSSQTINCGFTSGAKMVLIKRTDSTGNWNVWDSERGIVAGNDPRIELNDQYGTIDTGHDYIDPHNSGFIVNYVANDDDDSNINGASYIFYAVA